MPSRPFRRRSPVLLFFPSTVAPLRLSGVLIIQRTEGFYFFAFPHFTVVARKVFSIPDRAFRRSLLALPFFQFTEDVPRAPGIPDHPSYRRFPGLLRPNLL